MQSGNLIVWMTFGSKRDPALPDVPTVYAVVKNDADREVAQLIFGQDVLSRPLTAPPGVSIEPTAALRAAFLATMADAAFQDETTKAGLEIHAMDGAETQRRYQAFYDMPKSVVERAKKVIGRDAE